MKSLSYLIAPIVTIFVMLGIANLVMASMNLPNYGVWTGIRPIEEKIKKLEVFSKEGPIDAIVIGSSISDFGFSAELYSKLMSEKLGRPYRVFNFSTGAAELVTTPALMQIALTVATPKEIWISAPAEIKRGNIISPLSADYILSQAPIGAALKDQRLLKIDKSIWDLPLMEKSAAARDLLMFGSFKSLLGVGMDTYTVNSYGDRLSYSAGMIQESVLRSLTLSDLTSLKPLKKSVVEDLRAAQITYFPDIDIDGMADIKRIASSNGIKIVVLAHTAAVHLWLKSTTDADYLKGRNQYLDTLAKSVDGTLINPLDNLSTPDFAVMDGTHLNKYGAEIYTRALFRKATASEAPKTLDSDDIEQVSLQPVRARAPSFNGWAAVVMREPQQHDKSLRCRFVENFAVPAIPPTDIFFALRMPDGSDMISPARKLESGEYEANFDLKRNNKKQTLILRLLYRAGEKIPLNAPLEHCNWASHP